VSEASTQRDHRIISALRTAGNLEGALTLAQASEARVRGACGAAHARTLHAQWLLATVLHRLGEAAPSGDGMRDALALHRTVLAGRLQLLGASHPSTTESEYELGLCIQAIGLAASGDERASLLFEAETLFREACRAYAARTAGTPQRYTPLARHAPRASYPLAPHPLRQTTAFSDVCFELLTLVSSVYWLHLVYLPFF